ncbi:secretory carrier-associated membrane protein [Thecamonas trahens ATCC 50062]|uniref:Secretory carrier-associated membrane protein n=1 Tax=Thecamonas trahens ATCC 50062 TaxID=461836 RepID=A0A0L0DIN2_THETB|nr:secretory carrier-associated membrane protein [Thecamonas trahens ATCC 50062]KNC52152.1 secretory carrier-associated membrane protein [Thecamonas trahens ATCC 50062]|eukprot:XP_013762155.1 secretory carrier-associated membrane protein [Thecamonas trahens ATCC 50062]
MVDDNPFDEYSSDGGNPFDSHDRSGGSGEDAGGRAGAGTKSARAKVAADPISLAEKRAELDRLEDELNYREKTIEQREREALGARPANWPPCKPIVHMDIVEEIPAEAQSVVTNVYRLWILTYIMLVVNLAAIMTALIEDVTGVGPFALALLFALLSPLLAFYTWYWSLYNATRQAKASLFLIFFVCFFIHILGCLFYALGVPGTGAAGFIIAIKAFNDKATASGAFCLISAFVWLFDGCSAIYLMVRAHQYYRSQGHTLQDAKREAAVSVAT